jgi:hypothetical protein
VHARHGDLEPGQPDLLVRDEEARLGDHRVVGVPAAFEQERAADAVAGVGPLRVAGPLDRVGGHATGAERDDQVAGQFGSDLGQCLGEDQDARGVPLGVARTQPGHQRPLVAGHREHVRAQFGPDPRHVQGRVAGGQRVDRGVEHQVLAAAAPAQATDGVGLGGVEVLGGAGQAGGGQPVGQVVGQGGLAAGGAGDLGDRSDRGAQPVLGDPGQDGVEERVAHRPPPPGSISATAMPVSHSGITS